MLKPLVLTLLSMSVFISSCQNSVVSETESAPTATLQPSLPSETPAGPGEPTHANIPHCFTTTEGSPIAFMPDNTRLLIQERSGVQILNLETMEKEHFIPAPQEPNPVALSPDGELLAWSLADYSIQLIRITDGMLVKTMEGHTWPVTKLRFSRAGDRLFSASSDSWVRIWDRNGKLLDAFQPTGADNLPNEIEGIGISPDDTMLGSVPFDGPARIWNLADKKEIVNLGGTGGDVTSDIAFSADGQFVAADQAGRFSLWRTSDWKKILTGVSSMGFAFSPNGGSLAYSDMDNDFNVVIRALDETDERRILERQQIFIYDIFFSPDGSLLAAAGTGIHIWQVETGQLVYVGKETCP